VLHGITAVVAGGRKGVNGGLKKKSFKEGVVMGKDTPTTSKKLRSKHCAWRTCKMVRRKEAENGGLEEKMLGPARK